MVKHNNMIPGEHFHKHWQERVKTWFDQAPKKEARRHRRAKKAARVFPRPVSGLLRPLVHGQTRRYSAKVRLGRGFTHAELKQAGINRREARSIGISVDKRRFNHSQESLDLNVQRLKEYKSKLILFPIKASKPKSRDAKPDEIASATQVRGVVLPYTKPAPEQENAVITDEMREYSAVLGLKRAKRRAERVVRRERRKAAMNK